LAIFDEQRGQVVVRVVYDGPALAGKTTSVRALARSLGRPVFSGDEAEGRTLHFDWLDYVGGRFDGYPIRCQVVAVPGQTALVSRRMRLLESADAVVFVGDSRASALDESLRALEELRAFLQRWPAPAPGLVFQANKRDDAEAVSLELLRARLNLGPTVGLTESVATDGTGIRETFVFAVRLALDLVRARSSANMLNTGHPSIDSGEALLAALLAADSQSSLPRRAIEPASPPASRARTEPPPTVETAPRPPDATVPSGLVWPPIEGRLVLHEAHALGVVPQRLKNGDWFAAAGATWRCYSVAAAEFSELDAGRKALLDWARWHAGLAHWLSPGRCIALCRSSETSWRLWQIVKRVPTLRDQLSAAFESTNADEVALVLWRAVETLAHAETSLTPLGLPLNAATIAHAGPSVSYVGLMPCSAAPVGPQPSMPLTERIRAVLSPVLGAGRLAERLNVPSVLERLKTRATASTPADALETLQAMLIGH
jgi:signal recognition particle receptor subunit beta